MKEEFTEECWFLYGKKIGSFYFGWTVYHSEGTAGSVDFDWEKALKGNLLGWFHTHPGVKHILPSSTDNKTMRSWVRSAGRPMLCGIVCGDDMECYSYYRAKDKSIRCKSIKFKFIDMFFFGSVPIAQPE